MPGGARVCMDYHESWPKPSGLTAEGASLFASAHSSAAKKEDDWWTRAEGQTAELIDSLKPTRLSEERRTAVTGFVERLIRDRFECEVSALPHELNVANICLFVHFELYVTCSYLCRSYYLL